MKNPRTRIILCVCIGWCTNQASLRNARCNGKKKKVQNISPSEKSRIAGHSTQGFPVNADLQKPLLHAHLQNRAKGIAFTNMTSIVASLKICICRAFSSAGQTLFINHTNFVTVTGREKDLNTAVTARQIEWSVSAYPHAL